MSIHPKLCFINHWLKKWNYDTIFENLRWAERTSLDWRSFCSEITAHWLSDQDPIGGEDIVVEIDESCIRK